MLRKWDIKNYNQKRNFTNKINSKISNIKIMTPALGIFKPNINSLISIGNRIIGVILTIIFILLLLFEIKGFLFLNNNNNIEINQIGNNINFWNNELNFINQELEKINIKNIIIIFFAQIIIFLILYHYFYSWIKVESVLNNKSKLISTDVTKINKNYKIIFIILLTCFIFIGLIILNNNFMFKDISFVLIWLLLTSLFYFIFLK